PGKVTDIEEGSEIYFALFRRGWKYAVEQLTAAGKTVIVNEIKWASSNEKGEVFSPEEVLAANNRLERHYQIVREETPDVQWIRYSPEIFVADSGHRWGPSPIHFNERFYRTQLEQIERIVNG